MDIRKLQRTIVDALEDVKAQDIQVFNTEALTSLFDRVIVASGSSNRQTRSLAASVRDRVRAAGGSVRNPEGEGSGEWVLVDCGDAVVHIMQPVIRAYYKLEDIWGGKSVHLKARQDAVATAAAIAARSATVQPAAKKTVKPATKKAPTTKARTPANRAGASSATSNPARKAPTKRSAWPGTKPDSSADNNAPAARARTKSRASTSAAPSTAPAPRKRAAGSTSTSSAGKNTTTRRAPAKKSAS